MKTPRKRCFGYARPGEGSPSSTDQIARIRLVALRAHLRVDRIFRDEPLPEPIGLMTWELGGVSELLESVDATVLVWDEARLRVPGWGGEDPVAVLRSEKIPILQTSAPLPVPRVVKNAVKARKTLEGRVRSANRGNHVSGPVPYGYRRAADRSLEVDPVEADVVRSIFRAYLREGMTLKKVRAELVARSIRTKKGNHFAPFAINYLLRNPIYLGRVRFGSVSKAGNHEAIVSRRAFSRAERKLVASARRGPPATSCRMADERRAP